MKNTSDTAFIMMMLCFILAKMQGESFGGVLWLIIGIIWAISGLVRTFSK